MGRTVPSFRIVIVQEKKEWKLFRKGLDKKEKKEFDEMWDVARNYVSACSNSVQLVPLQPILISILFHHYKELMDCMEDIKQMMEDEEEVAAGAGVVVGSSKQALLMEEEEK